MNHSSPSGRQRDRTYVKKVADDYLRRFPHLDRRALEITLAFNASFRSAADVHEDAAYAIGLGHTLGRLGLLRVLFFADGKPMSQTALGKELQVTPSSITSMVTGLERDGLVTRVASSSDRRVLFVSLTPEGADVAARMLPLMSEVSRELWSLFTDEEQETFLNLLFKFLDKVPDRDLRPGRTLPRR